MYKTLTFEEIQSIKSPFFSNLKKIYEKQGFIYFKQFIKKINEDIIDEILYFSAGEIYFRIVLEDNNLEIIDEKQAIKLKLTDETILKVHNSLKKKIDNTGKKNIANTLVENFGKENMENYLGKHFLVYDIETVGNIQNLKETRFMVGYVIDSKDYKDETAPKYKYVSEKNLNKFVDYLINYDGYIIGYNNIAFDNPVVVYNSAIPENEWDEKIKIINEKSLDLFHVYSKIFGKRIGLNAVATNIVGVSKTLSSGAEGAQLLKHYNETGDQAALNKVKNYCKNDVKMTLTILLYLLFNGNISYNGVEKKIDIDYIKEHGCLIVENEIKNNILGL